MRKTVTSYFFKDNQLPVVWDHNKQNTQFISNNELLLFELQQLVHSGSDIRTFFIPAPFLRWYDDFV